MYVTFIIVWLINLFILDVQGFKFFSFYNNRKRFVRVRSASILTDKPVLIKWIKQKLDHFDEKNNRTWKMRYFSRLDYWRQNGPIYYLLGGESTASPGDLLSGLVHELAKETKGALFMSEHRYYGESQPVKKRSVEAMKFLSTPQALADNANLISVIKKNVRFKESKVVIVGASYAGNLAAWLKLVYPDLVDAAIASSAPILAKRDFFESFEVINRDYKKYGSSDCIKKIRRLFQKYDSLFQTKKGIKTLKIEDNICEEVDLTKPENKVIFFIAKVDPFISLAQDGNINDIRDHCNKINGTHDGFTEKDNEEYWFNEGNCNMYDFDRMIQLFYEDRNEYSWIYQTCTEYGYFFSTTSNNQPFTKNIPVEFNDKICTALFGQDFGKDRVIDGVTKINQMYGGRSPNVTKVIFVNGELDPWSSLSVLEDVSPQVPAIYIHKASHCNELVFEQDDPQELKKARSYIKYLIKKWTDGPKPITFEFNLTINICEHC